MIKLYWILGIIFIFLLAVIIGDRKPTVTINSHTFNLYIAKTSKDKEIGLSKYNNIPQNFGMIFIFDKSDFYSFWMKDMKFSIDILFIKDNHIVTLYKNVSRPNTPNKTLLTYKPKSSANLVLEINAGLSQKYNIKEGDTIILKNL